MKTQMISNDADYNYNEQKLDEYLNEESCQVAVEAKS